MLSTTLFALAQAAEQPKTSSIIQTGLPASGYRSVCRDTASLAKH